MSKLRSQLNNLSADAHTDMNQVSQNVPGGYIQQQNAQRQGHMRENQQKLAEIKSAIESLTGKLNAAAASHTPPPPPPQPAPQPAPAVNIDPDRLARSVATSLSADLRDNISVEIDRILLELNQLQSNAGESSDRAVLNDIQKISEGIQELQSYQSNTQEQFNELSGGLRGIHQDVRNLANNGSNEAEYEKISETIQLAYNEIANRLDNLGTSGTDEQIFGLSEKLENIKEGIASTDPETLKRIEQQLHDLGERVSLLANEQISEDGESLNELLPEYFEGFDRRLDEITRAVMASATHEPKQESDAFERIEARINSLAKSFDNISIDAQHFAENPQMPEQLQNTLAKLEAYIEQKPAQNAKQEPGADLEFTNQLAALNDKIDHLYSENSNRSETGNSGPELMSRLDNLALTLERAINSGDGSVEQLEKQIAQLSQRIDDAVNYEQEEQNVREQQEVAIAEQLKMISEKVEALEPGQSSGPDYHAQLVALEGQITSISSQLSSINELPDFNSIEQRLGGIEEQFVSSRDAAIEAATQAIQKAGISGSSDENSQLIASLAEDLKNLSESSQELRGHSLETFDAIRESLSMILDRINSIEVRMANDESDQEFGFAEQTPDQYHHNADMVNAAREYASSLTKKAQMAEETTQAEPSRLATLAEEAHAHDSYSHEVAHQGNHEEAVHEQEVETAQVPVVDAPSLEVENLPEMAEVHQPVEAEEPVDMPIEPGSGAPTVNSNSPDMNELFRQAKENNRNQILEDEQQNPTDFIAAARRAAQAAASEAETIAEVDEEKPEKSGFSFSKLLAKKKKVVMLSAAAIVLALLAAPAYMFLKNKTGNNLLTQSKPVAIEQNVEQVSTKAEPKVTKEAAAPKKVKVAEPEVVQNKPVVADVETPKIQANNQVASTPVATDRVNQDPVVIQNNVTDPTSIQSPLASVETNKPQLDRPVVQEVENPVAIPTPPKEVGPVVLRQAAANGDPMALFEVGRRYTQGIAGVPDFAEAIKWYKLSADKNYAPAQYRLGNFNEKGHGVQRDVNKAAYWYEQAANQGNALAMHNLAVVNAMGVLEGGTNMESATDWFEKAAQYGVKDSQVNLGVIYATAMGVDADLVKAYKWFAIAAKAGDKDAAEKRDTIAKRLKADELKAARGEVELWRPQEMKKDINSVDIPAAWKIAPELTASLSTKEMILRTQSLLNKLGFNAGTADGLMGNKTVAAIKKFQAKAGLPVTGKVDNNLLQALERS